MTPTQFTIGLTKDDAVAYLSNLEGLIPSEVCRELYELAHDIPKELAIVELGSFKGQSACSLAAGAQSGFGAHVWAIDPWDLPGNAMGKHDFADPQVRATFERQVEQAGLAEHVTPVRAFSYDAADTWQGPAVGLLYVDGDHRYASVMKDYLSWEKHLVVGAVVVFDDLDTKNNPGVRQVVNRLDGVLHCEKRAGRLAVGKLL